MNRSGEWEHVSGGGSPGRLALTVLRSVHHPELAAGGGVGHGRAADAHLRTVSSTLGATGRGQAKDFASYHAVLNRNRWSALAVAKVLLGVLVARFAVSGPVVIGMDDTIERRWGAKIKARGIYRDPVRSSHGHFVKASGLRWLSAMLLMPLPWAHRVWALPFLTVLAPSERSTRESGRRYKALSAWARQMMLQIARWLPGRRIVVVADSSFSAIDLLDAVRERVYGQALLDRKLYLPESWAKDPARCSRASIPEAVEFVTKPKMARAMIEAALNAGARCAYVLGDAVYGADSSLRRMLEGHHQPYVLAVRGAHAMRRGGARGFEQTSPEELASEVVSEDWTRHAAGEGSKGPRLYDWARVRRPWTSDKGFEHWLLVRRKRSDARETAYYLAFAPPGVTLAELAAVSGLRWAIEECFERAKGDLGLDHCEARSWHGWYCHMTLCTAALAFLSKLSADLRRSAWSKPNETSPPNPMGA